MKRFLLILIIFQFSILFSQSDESIVEEKLEIVLSEIDNDEISQWELPPFLERLLEFFGNLSYLFRILFLLILAGLVIFALYKIIGFFLKDKRISSKSIRIDTNDDERKIARSKNKYLEQALHFYEQKDYSMAILMLHKGSIEFLYERNILNRNRDYTNREIFSLLNNRNYFKPFHQIALLAEQILFNDSKGQKKDYLSFEKLYREYFL